MFYIVTGNSLSGKTASMLHIAIEQSKKDKKILFISSKNEDLRSIVLVLGFNIDYLNIDFVECDEHDEHDIFNVLNNPKNLNYNYIFVNDMDVYLSHKDVRDLVQNLAIETPSINYYMEFVEPDLMTYHISNRIEISCEYDKMTSIINYKNEKTEEIISLIGFNKNYHNK